MFEYEIVERKDGIIYYKIWDICDKNAYAICYVNTKTHDYGFSDEGTLYRSWAGHMFRRIREFIETGIYEENGMIAVF